jgi:uncharacterized Fe-S cluster-containing protein
VRVLVPRRKRRSKPLSVIGLILAIVVRSQRVNGISLHSLPQCLFDSAVAHYQQQLHAAHTEIHRLNTILRQAPPHTQQHPQGVCQHCAHREQREQALQHGAAAKEHELVGLLQSKTAECQSLREQVSNDCHISCTRRLRVMLPAVGCPECCEPQGERCRTLQNALWACFMLRRCNPCAAYFLQVEFFKSEAEEATTALISNQHGTRDAQAQVEGLTQQLQGYAVRCQQLELEVAAAKSALTASAPAVATATHAGSSTEHAGIQAEPDAVAVAAQTDSQPAVHLSDASSQSAPAPAQSHATTQSDTPAEDLATAVHPMSAIAVTQTEDVTGQQTALAVKPAPAPVLSAASQTEAEVAAVPAEVQSHETAVAERDDVSQRLTLLQSEYNALEALYSTSVASHEGQVSTLRTQLLTTVAEYEVRLQGLMEEITAARSALSAAEGLAAVATPDTVVSHTDTTVAETRDGTPPAAAAVSTGAPPSESAADMVEPGPAASLLAEVHTLRTELDTASAAAQAAQRRYEVEIQSLAFQLERRNDDFAHAELRLRAELDRTEQDLMQAREAVLAKARQLAEVEGELVGQQRLVELLNERVSKQAQHSAVVEQECARLQEEVGGLLNRMRAAQNRVTDASSAAASPYTPQSSEAKEVAADASSELALAAPIIVAAAKEYANVSTTLQLQLNSLKTINELMVENLRGKDYFLETIA